MRNNNKKVPHSKSNPLKFNVTESLPLMDFLMKKLDGISRSKVKRMLANKTISVDGERTTQFDFALQPGMVVEIGKPTAKERFRNPWLNIVYEDKYLLVIDKKEGLLTAPPRRKTPPRASSTTISSTPNNVAEPTPSTASTATPAA